MARVAFLLAPAVLGASAGAELDAHDAAVLLQTSARTRVMQEPSTPDYFWPSGRGRVGNYTASPYHADWDLTSPTWTWHHEQGQWSTIPVGTSIDDVKNIYLTVADGMRKFTPDGQLLWTYKRRSFGPPEEINNAASLWNGAAYGITNQGRAFAVSMASGDEVWSTQVSGNSDGNNGFVSAHAGVVLTAVDASPHIAGRADTNGAANHRVVGLNATDGALLWSYTPDVALWNFMPSFAGDGTFVFQDLEGRAHRCRLSDGSLIWKAGGVPGSWTDGSALLGPNGIVYAVANFENGGHSQGSVSAFALTDGAPLWSRTVPKSPNNMPAIGRLPHREGLSVVQPVGWQCELGQQVDLYAFDALTGAQQWIFEGPTQVGPMVAGDAEGMQERMAMGIRQITLPNPWSAPTIDGEGVVYIGSETGQFYALRDSNGDGLVSGDQDVSALNTGAAFVGSSGPAIAPGLLAVGSINQLFVWKA